MKTKFFISLILLAMSVVGLNARKEFAVRDNRSYLVDKKGKILMFHLRGEVLVYAMEYQLAKDAK